MPPLRVSVWQGCYPIRCANWFFRASSSLFSIAAENDPWPVSLLYPSRGLMPLKVRAFLDFATPQLKKRLGAI